MGKRGGFTFVELLISLTVGLILVVASLSFAISTFQGAEGNRLREEVYRNGRFIGMSLHRDVQGAGVGIESAVDFGTLKTFNDTLVVLAVPWVPTLSPAHSLAAPFGTDNPLDPGGTCGPLCLDLAKDANGGYDLAPGDLARLQVEAERRLVIVDAVRDLGATFQIDVLELDEILGYPATFGEALRLDRHQTTVQKLHPVVYFVEESILYRAQSFDATGALRASPMAYGVIDWSTWLIFEDLDEATEADPTDADVTNDFDDLLGVRVTATVASNRLDMRVNDGELFTREFEWTIMPRNLMYERNR